MFCLQVDSISHHIASGQPLEVTQTIAPHPVTEIQPILDAENITLQWPRPDGRIGKTNFYIKQYAGNSGKDQISRIIAWIEYCQFCFEFIECRVPEVSSVEDDCFVQICTM
jgi:hypothetical protein